MRALLVDDRPDSSGRFQDLLAQRGFDAVACSMQEAIERLSSPGEKFQLTLCNYSGKSRALLKLYAELTSPFFTVMLNREGPFEFEQLRRLAPLVQLSLNDEKGLIAQLEKIKAAADEEYRDDDSFLRLSVLGPRLSRPLHADIYIRLGPNHYCKRFQAIDGFTAEDLELHFRQPGIEFFYVRRAEAEKILSNRAADVDSAIDKYTTAESARAEAEESMELVHDVVSQIGFTPKVQELAKKTVTLVLKTIGKNPSLAEITSKLKVSDGKYISSHSVMLAEVACAVGYRIGWSTGAIFMKLTLASFLHDISLTSQRLAQVRLLAGLTAANGFSDGDREQVKFHPIRGAEYAGKFNDIPSDVDTIISQHHECPDGSGFPRGLHAHQFNPLASIFLVAHDLLDFHLGHWAENSSTPSMEIFLLEKSELYAQGSFRKISDSLKTGKIFEI